MKKNKKFSFVLSLTITGILTVGAVSVFANDPLTSQVKTIQKETNVNNNAEHKILLQVGSEKITNTELANYKAYKSIESNPTLDDQQLLEEMATEKLYLLLAEKQGVAATLADGKKEAEKNRGILEQQPQEVQDTQKKLIESMGMSEDQYWNKYAPAEYQKILSEQNLTQQLIRENKININQDSISTSQKSLNVAQELKEYKHELFESALSNNEIKVVDSSISFK